MEKDIDPEMKICGKTHLGDHAMVRRVDPHGAALVSCRKCSGCARCRLGPKLMNRSRLKKKDTKEHGKMFLKKILKLEKESSWTRP